MFHERDWTSPRLRRILDSIFGRYTGSGMTVAGWRHIAISISQRYLQDDFQQASEDQDEDEDAGFSNKTMDHADDAWSLQAGHGSLIAGLVYARLVQQGLVGTASQQEQFRRISCRWHEYWQLGLASDGRTARPAYMQAERQTQILRLRRLSRVDLDGQLRQFFNEPKARFRGVQEQAIRAVLDGHTPIVQVAGTGEGKSLTFMLPAYCEPSGVTIVVVPMLALRADMEQRCRQAGLSVSVWESGGGRVASMVLVTPETALTKGFAEFVSRLRDRQQLDRVVVDEAHLLLESNWAFRPALKLLGQRLSEMGVQRVFLTATLSPDDEEELFQTDLYSFE